MRENPFRAIYDAQTYHGWETFRFPDIVDIELTNHCNLNCKMCARQNMTRLKGFMSPETFHAITTEVVQNNASLRMIGWGEPFLHPKIIEFCQLFKSRSVINPITLEEKKSLLHITSNGHLITKAQMQALVDLELDSIVFSFQGATSQGYEQMRVGASYQKISDNIKNFVAIRGDKLKPFIQISSTMTFETKEEIGNFVNEWEKIVDYVGIGRTKNIKAPQEGYIYYRPCTEVFHKLTVKWDGQVSACCGDYDNELIVGNLSQSTLYNIWNKNKVFDAIRTLLTNNKFRCLSLCKNCDHAYLDF